MRGDSKLKFTSKLITASTGEVVTRHSLHPSKSLLPGNTGLFHVLYQEQHPFEQQAHFIPEPSFVANALI